MHRYRLAGCIALVAALSLCAHGLEDGVVRTTNYGRVEGTRDFLKNTLSWKGIPYAQAERFGAPEPPTPWTETRAATTQTLGCPQLLGQVPSGSEDCLTVDVYAPKNSTSESRLPVFVWIFGGGFEIGYVRPPPRRAAARPLTPATRRSSYEFGLYSGVRRSQTHNVVIVSMNYRLGPLGSLVVDGLSDGRMNVLDQRAALQWVRDNVAAFGGDAGRVTLGGQSAGGMSTLFHVAAKESAGLFHQAVVESGQGASFAFFRQREDAAAFSAVWANNTVCKGDVECLRTAPWADLFKSGDVSAEQAARIHGALYAPVFNWNIVVEGATPTELIEQGTFSHVPLLIGTNADEGSLLVKRIDAFFPNETDWVDPVDERECTMMITKMLGEKEAQAVIESDLYRYAAFPSASDMCATALSDYFFTNDAERVAIAATKHGVPVHRYLFDFANEDTSSFGDTHGFELFFVWDRLLATERARDMGVTVGNYWFDWFVSGRGAADALAWPAYGSARNVMVLDEPECAVKPGYFDAVHAFWGNPPRPPPLRAQ